LLIIVVGTWYGAGVITIVGTVDGTNVYGIITIDEWNGTVWISVDGKYSGT